MPIQAEMPYRKRYVEVNGRRMACVDVGEGPAIVFLHGNPTSSYLWRNVMPHLEGRGRLIAPDLIGMGDSDKLAPSGPDRYRFVEHREFLDALLAALSIGDRAIFVAHDWGSALAFDWACRHPERVCGLAYMEAIIRPMRWADMPGKVRPVFEGFRSEEGERLVLDENAFVEKVLPSSIQRELEPAEMEEYRRPFAEPGEGRRPTLTWPREIPLDGEPADVVEIVTRYADWLRESAVPKLCITADPGALLRGETLAFARGLPNQTEVTVPGIHFVQEDAPDAIGSAVCDWLDSTAAA